MVTVFDIDDLCDEFDPWDELMALKEKNPGLKATIFAIPSRCSDELLDKYRKLDWVELCPHGYHHSSYECGVWDYDEAESKLEELEEAGWPKVFKAPGWISNSHFYQVLSRRGWIVADNVKYHDAWGPAELKRYVYNATPHINSVHGHTWDTCGNGPSDWPEKIEGEFKFVSEVADWKAPKTYLWAVLDEMELEPGDLFVDCGAYTGDEIEVLEPMGVKVLSYEPHPELAAKLQDRWRGNENVEIVDKAVDVTEKTATLVEDVESEQGATLDTIKLNARGREFKVQTVQLANELRGRDVKVLKLDIEGAEWRVLDDLLDAGVLQKIPHIYLEDHADRMGDPKVHELRRRVLARCKSEGVELKTWM